MQKTSFALRPATVEDAAELSAFAARVFVETFGKDNTAEDMEQYVRSAFSTELQAREIAEARAEGFVLLAYAPAGTLAGYAHLTRSEVPASVGEADPKAIELKRFYVSKEWQGSGLAASLMAVTKRRAQTRGARTLWLGVWEHNARAIAFYRKHGFREVGSHAFWVGADQQTDLEMALSLDDAGK